MKILMINSVCGIGSTGRICTDLAAELEKQGHDVKIAYGRGEVPKQFDKYAIRIGTDLGIKLHGIKARIQDASGFGSKRVTDKFVQWIKYYDPDIIHLHNIHGYYINIESLFNYLKRCNKKIIWTLHDCWSFTGHCAYFDYANCDKWKFQCQKCEQKREYPRSLVLDRSKYNFILKKELFTDIPNMTIVVPSKWLKELVKQSFLKEYPIKVIYNGIDVSVFRPLKSDIYKKYNCGDKKIILGVAGVWDRRKGLNSFVTLSQLLSDEYQIVLIGLSKEQLSDIPTNIIGIERTESVQELSQFYSAADVFVNPTLEDNYPTTNLEAIACGTPVISYRTGGSGESASKYGMVVKKGDINALKAAIIKVSKGEVVKQEIALSREEMIEEYRKVYEDC